MLELLIAIVCVSLPFLILKKVYFGRVSMIMLRSDGVIVPLSIRPYRRYISQYLGRDYGKLRLTSGVFAWYSSDGEEDSYRYRDLVISGHVIVFCSGVRYRNVDLSDRLFYDCLSNFKFIGEK